MSEQDVITREELTRVLQETYMTLQQEMRAHLLSIRGISCSAQMSTIEHIARQFGITLERLPPDQPQGGQQ